MEEKNHFETLTPQTLASDWNLVYKQKRFENWEQVQLPQYCLFYQIELIRSKNTYLDIVWFADEEDLSAFLMCEFPLNYIGHFTNYYTENPSFNTDLEYFFKHDVEKMESALHGYRTALSECTEQIDAQQFTKISENHLHNPKWFKERKQRYLFLGEVSLLASCNHPAILNLIDIFTLAKKNLKIDADMVQDMVYFFNIFTALEELETGLIQTTQRKKPVLLQPNYRDYLKRTLLFIQENCDAFRSEVLRTNLNERLARFEQNLEDLKNTINK